MRPQASRHLHAGTSASGSPHLTGEPGFAVAPFHAPRAYEEPQLRRGVDPAQRRPREQQPLLARVDEANANLGLVAVSLEVDDDALAELLVHDVVAETDADALGTARAGRAGRAAVAPAQRGVDNCLAVAAGVTRCATNEVAADGVDQLFGYLFEEP